MAESQFLANLKQLMTSMEQYIKSLENKEIRDLVGRGNYMEQSYLNTLKPIELTKNLLENSIEEEIVKARKMS